MIEYSGGVTRLRYASTSLIELLDAQAVVHRLLLEARPRNHANGITGALMSHEDKFIQQLEGPKDNVMRLYENITKDTRHKSVTIISCDDNQDRIFTEWSMLLVGGEAENDVPLYASKTTFTEGAALKLTDAQSAELSSLREILRAS